MKPRNQFDSYLFELLWSQFHHQLYVQLQGRLYGEVDGRFEDQLYALLGLWGSLYCQLEESYEET